MQQITDKINMDSWWKFIFSTLLFGWCYVLCCDLWSMVYNFIKLNINYDIFVGSPHFDTGRALLALSQSWTFLQLTITLVPYIVHYDAPVLRTYLE